MLFLYRIGDNMKRRYIFMFAILAVCIIMLGSSFAYLKDIEESSINASINLAKFDVQLVQDVVGVTLDKMYPMKDSEGVNNTPITFAIQNKGGVDASYRITLADGTPKAGVTYMKNSDVRYQLTKTIGSGTPQVLGPFTLPDSGVIDEGNITAGENNNGQIISYELVVWVDYNANPNGQKFSKYVVVDGMQVASLDTSGANFPELTDNMIPVYYEATSTTEGVWKKADSKNVDSNYKWFDYNNQMWANAVTVKENGTQTRDYYLSAANGTTISMDDITTMWVWIPRFKYIIPNPENTTISEQTMDITFEHGRDKTGTVTCQDNIQTSANSTSSETCTDSKYSTVTPKKSTYTHPAFTFGDEELTGFWMAKFEASTDDTNCNSTLETDYNNINNSATPPIPGQESSTITITDEMINNCNKTGLNILVKPNVYDLRYQNVSNLFTNMRNMEIYNNIHGFNNSKNATVTNTTGEITNDSNTIDTHMMKNMEWGAVSYLYLSKYGKYGNNLYTDIYKNLYGNRSYKTGYSDVTSISERNNSKFYVPPVPMMSTSISYSNTTLTTDKGYSGAGASTTGNVYGIYDLYGGASEYVMGNSVSSSGEFNVSSAGTLNPIAKYYDKYSYNTSATDNYNKRIKLGETPADLLTGIGLGTVTPNLPNGTNSWIVRGIKFLGGGNDNSMRAAYACDGNYNADYGSRPVLVITRNMPWLNSN